MECQNERELQQNLADTTAALDLSCFAYLALPRQPTAVPRLISNYPELWTSHYIEMRYERLDPVIARVLRQTDPFTWGLGFKTQGNTDSDGPIFEEAARFGIRCGLTVPIHDTTGAIAAITFAADMPRPPFERMIEKHACVLQLMAMYFHAHASRKVASNRLAEGISLSPRERECLKWAAEGKSAWQTGAIIGISQHTVTFHLENAKAKLGVRSTIQAVAHLAKANQSI
jgi:DNA-binding CsgD family transcriptional regulator